MSIERLLVDSTLKVSLIVFVALAGAAMLRRRSAALRHWILAAALLCAAATPALRFVVPAWEVRPAAVSDAVLQVLPEPPVHAASSTGAPRRKPETSVRFLAWIWWVGFSVNLGMLAMGLSRLWWLASRARGNEDARWTAAADEIAGRYGIRRAVALLQSDHPTLLVTWGLVAPKVILPAGAQTWSDERMRIVIGHELAHIHRRDWAVLILSSLLRAAHWFNPLVWIACARLRRESEHACDDAVLSLGINRTTYASELVDLARTFNAYRRTSFEMSPAPAMARRSNLERRVRAMLNAEGNRRPVTRAAAIAIASGLLAVTLPLAGLGAQSGPASFSGTLQDMIGRVMPDVVMTLTHTESGATVQGRSDGNGLFAFSGLPAGDYELEVPTPGFQPKYRIALRAGQQLQQPVTLQLGTLQETINVVKWAAAPAPRPVREDIATAPRQPGPCDLSTIGGCIEPPMKIYDARPRYPDGRSENVTIELRARIGTDGRVKSADPLMTATGDRDFADAAAEAVKQWRFTTTYLDGVPVEVEMKVTIYFRAE
jgi:beta-lactamase regulating signal transducer with metallopeptidase domain